jgi:tripartite-type tricarboxylate transporter receptor subunit TctC
VRTPHGVVDFLGGAMTKVMADRAFLDTLVKLGVDPITDSGPDKAAAMIRTELAKWRPIIQALGLRADTPTRSASPRR